MFILKQPPQLPRRLYPIVRITETLTTAPHCQKFEPENRACNALVLDARRATRMTDLNWLFHASQRHSNSNAFRKPGGRVVILRSCPSKSQNPEMSAVSEAMVGFAMSLAKENGSRGATVNTIRSDPGERVEEPLEWLLSHRSCYVTGQELEVVKAAVQENKPPGAILLTGSAGGIGKATAEFFSRVEEATNEMPKLLLTDHPSTASKLKTIRDHLSDSGRIVEVLPLDLTEAGAGDIIADAGVDLGGFERVIHAAGITRDKTLRNMSYENSWLPVLEVNLRSVLDIDDKLLSTKGALYYRRSSFVYFSSTSANGNAGQSNYAASKSGLLGYAKAMAKNHPESSFHVCSPGFIATDMTQKMPFLVRWVASKLNALGQAGKPEDVAAAVAFLSSRGATGLAPGFHLRVCGLFMGGR